MRSPTPLVGDEQPGTGRAQWAGNFACLIRGGAPRLRIPHVLVGHAAVDEDFVWGGVGGGGGMKKKQ